MRLAVFNDYVIGVVKGDKVVDVSAAIADLPRSSPAHLMTVLIEHFEDYRDRIEAAASNGNGVPLSQVRLRPPLPKPPGIVCMAVNYNDGMFPPKAINAFPKVPSCIAGHGDTMVLQDFPATIFEGEPEIGVIIGREARDVSEADAMKHVFGYTNFIDGSARGVPAFYQMKSRANYAPIGPFIVTADEIADPQQLQIRAWTNGDLMHDFNTRDMANSIARTISWLSGVHVLEPGTLIGTGTHHAGLNPLQGGDVMEMEVEGLGRLQIDVKDDLNRTWARVTRFDLKDVLPRGSTTPQLTGKYAPAPESDNEVQHSAAGILA